LSIPESPQKKRFVLKGEQKHTPGAPADDLKINLFAITSIVNNK